MKKVIISIMVMVAVLITMGTGLNKNDSYAQSMSKEPVQVVKAEDENKTDEVKQIKAGKVKNEVKQDKAQNDIKKKSHISAKSTSDVIIEKTPGKKTTVCLNAHDWKCYKTVDATCQSEGTKQYKCLNCDAKKNTTIGKKDHEIVCITSCMDVTEEYTQVSKKYACKYCGGEQTTTSSIKLNEEYVKKQKEEREKISENATAKYTVAGDKQTGAYGLVDSTYGQCTTECYQ